MSCGPHAVQQSHWPGADTGVSASAPAGLPRPQVGYSIPSGGSGFTGSSGSAGASAAGGGPYSNWSFGSLGGHPQVASHHPWGPPNPTGFRPSASGSNGGFYAGHGVSEAAQGSYHWVPSHQPRASGTPAPAASRQWMPWAGPYPNAVGATVAPSHGGFSAGGGQGPGLAQGWGGLGAGATTFADCGPTTGGWRASSGGMESAHAQAGANLWDPRAEPFAPYAGTGSGGDGSQGPGGWALAGLGPQAMHWSQQTQAQPEAAMLRSQPEVQSEPEQLEVTHPGPGPLAQPVRRRRKGVALGTGSTRNDGAGYAAVAALPAPMPLDYNLIPEVNSR